MPNALLDSLKFVSTAVAKKDFVPELMHFKIKNGRITSYNGRIALSSPIDLDLDIQPAAIPLINAIRACETTETIALNMTPVGRLAVRAGSFRAYINCLPDDQTGFTVEPEGEKFFVAYNFLDGIKAIAPVMGVDASRPWSMGIKIQDELMYATNNILLVKYWFGIPYPIIKGSIEEVPTLQPIPRINTIIPSDAINELLRINENPEIIQATSNSITFHFSGERWLRSQLIESSGWPDDIIKRVLDQPVGVQIRLPKNFEEALETLGAFLGESNTIYLTTDRILTSRHEGEGACVETDLDLQEMQAYSHHNLKLLCKVAETIDWSSYPRPCVFEGKNLLGVIIGQKII
jgi:hypothetical protein